jgi:hypothetical protein
VIRGATTASYRLYRLNADNSMDIPIDIEMETDEETVERVVSLDHEYVTEYGRKGGWYLRSRLKRTNARKASILLRTASFSDQPGSVSCTE